MSGGRVSKKQKPEFTVYIRFYKKDSQFLKEYKEASRFSDMTNSKLILEAIKDATLLRQLMTLFKKETFSLSEAMTAELIRHANNNHSKQRKGGELNAASTNLHK